MDKGSNINNHLVKFYHYGENKDNFETLIH
jgi:hypothetical protein